MSLSARLHKFMAFGTHFKIGKFKRRFNASENMKICIKSNEVWASS